MFVSFAIGLFIACFFSSPRHLSTLRSLRVPYPGRSHERAQSLKRVFFRATQRAKRTGAIAQRVGKPERTVVRESCEQCEQGHKVSYKKIGLITDLQMGRVGLEPTRCRHRRILSPLRLPIPPPPHTIILSDTSLKSRLKCFLLLFCENISIF